MNINDEGVFRSLLSMVLDHMSSLFILVNVISDFPRVIKCSGL